MMFSMLGALGADGLELIREGVMARLQAPKYRGATKGRPSKMNE